MIRLSSAISTTDESRATPSVVASTLGGRMITLSGQRLPSGPELAEIYGVTKVTATKAIRCPDCPSPTWIKLAYAPRPSRVPTRPPRRPLRAHAASINI
ncbi:hypothetical protein E1202_04385 [Saccharopolyspora karakumensis]|uniref:Regulatory protein, gntR family n=1 Tax=Saccharopolyspora karakumensis TaxID=2530386 RepID=A0A4R5C137_9PSEU|nr:hypothetical protein [Saccharopolyspora karakumensis]TDD91976.1 hypothetical protein E1202_04385 [Saccharopolyspora karakumensis]